MSIPQLAARADAVVHARVLASHAEWRDRVIVTISEIEVIEVLRGAAPRRLRLLQLGGQVGDHAMPVAGVAELGVGDEQVLFLRHSGEAAQLYHLAGMSQGALRFLDDRTLLWAPTALLFDGRRLYEPQPRQLSLDDLRALARSQP